ncbi:hypothetical protein AYL99_05095 [Fonsecaea erecta]|uniref:Uncharacterized protein n=1 Tax=Fonsecaea erecta TaxID=1367422 RepID=A0A178ZLJ3_9EURO|nr:hypothetical protein AYL99_05095 [Fonsecaea erecta]OAP60093.1 hypothetical protein AYL99_05095 [Fonsecaea erecta]
MASFSSSKSSSAPAVKEQPSGPSEQPTPPKTYFSFYDKIGLLATCTLSIGLALIILSLGFLWFLWLGNDGISFWRTVIDRNWTSRAVALSSLAIRQSVSFHASAATAMLASLALEHTAVLLLNLASVSTTRNANGGPYMLSWWLWKAFRFNPRRWKTVSLPLLIAVLASTTALVQFTSFALLSDVAVVVARASSQTKQSPTHFAYGQDGAIPVVTHGSTWSQQLQSYPSFAEYHEPPAQDLPDGVDDTGLTLRAFLPVVNQQTRSMVASWDGVATVLDARTVCIRPTLVNPRVHYADESLGFETGFTVDLGTYDPQKLGLQPVSSPEFECASGNCPGDIACMVPLSALAGNGHTQLSSTQAQFPQWRLVACQPAGSVEETPFLLQSQFQVPGQETRENPPAGGDPNYSFGNAYLVLNVSSGSEADWAQALPGEDPNQGIFRGAGTPPVGYSVHGQKNEWYDLIYSDDATLNLSVSLCYTAFDTADLHVQIDSSGNHSDLTPSWNTARQAYEYDAIRGQLGQDRDTGAATYSRDWRGRNIMNLQKRDSWIPEPDFGDYLVPQDRVTQTSWITDYANMAGSLQSNAFNYLPGGNCTRMLWQSYQLAGMWSSQMSYDYADASLTGLVQEILQAGGSLSFAMQSIVTVLSELAYYQQVQQLNGVSNVTAAPYVQASAPVRKRGLIAVTIVLGVHLLVVLGLILPAFLRRTNISSLGNAWQAVAQLIDSTTEPILRKAPLATESEAEQEVKVPVGKKNKLKNHDIVGLYTPDGHSVKIKSAVVENNDVEDAQHPRGPASVNAPAAAAANDGNGHGDEPQEQNALLRDDEQ